MGSRTSKDKVGQVKFNENCSSVIGGLPFK